MQHIAPLEDSTDLPDDAEEKIGLDFCIHDQHWLDYCQLGGHEHYELPAAQQRYASAA